MSKKKRAPAAPQAAKKVAKQAAKQPKSLKKAKPVKKGRFNKGPSKADKADDGTPRSKLWAGPPITKPAT